MVKLPKKKVNKEKLEPLSDILMRKIRQWILTGFFNKKREIDEYLLFNACCKHPERIRQFLIDALSKKNKFPSMFTLMVLSSDGIASKKVFLDMFNSVITTVKELLQFYHTIKNDHGINRVTKKAIVNWLTHNMILLEKECEEKTIFEDVDISKLIKDYKLKGKNKKEIEVIDFLKGVGTTLDHNPILAKNIEEKKEESKNNFFAKIREWNKKKYA